MRTTVRLSDSILRQAKHYALQHGKTLTQTLEEALSILLNRPEKSLTTKRVKLPTFKGKGLCPGVDLDDTQSLLDRMEGR